MWRKINKTQNDQTNRSKEIEVDIERKKEMNTGMGMNECISCLMIWIYRYTLHYAYETFIAMDVSLAQRICETWKYKNLKCFIFAGARDHTSKKLDINIPIHTHTQLLRLFGAYLCVSPITREKKMWRKNTISILKKKERAAAALAASSFVCWCCCFSIKSLENCLKIESCVVGKRKWKPCKTSNNKNQSVSQSVDWHTV